MLNLLIQKQKIIGATDKKFASLLGVKQSMWNQVKNGKKCKGKLSDHILKHVIHNFPDLKQEALNEMGLGNEIISPRA